METVVTVLLAYLAVTAGCLPVTIRWRYRVLRASHPHTHPRDVAYDLRRAVTGGLGRALLWLPIGTFRLGMRLAVLLGVTAVGRRQVARHVRDARTAMLEAELAAMDPPEDLPSLLRQTHELRAALDDYAAHHGGAEVEPVRRRVEAREERLSRRLAGRGRGGVHRPARAVRDRRP
jgi:hypothetical protein